MEYGFIRRFYLSELIAINTVVSFRSHKITAISYYGWVAFDKAFCDGTTVDCKTVIACWPGNCKREVRHGLQYATVIIDGMID